MSRKLALKRLTASDLTLFKWHFQNRPAGNQKAFNLDARALVGDLYPQLGEPSDIPQPRFPLDLYILGPGFAPSNNLQRKILKQKKNWRLNGELIDNPVDDPQRYNILAPGDFALFEFSGNVVPTSAKIVLVAKGEPVDAVVHALLSQLDPGASMKVLGEAEISEVLGRASLPVGHPLHAWAESEVIEDAVLGGAAGIAKVCRGRAGRGISPEDFIQLRQAAERTGVAGEEILNDYFEQQLTLGELEELEWTSSINAVSPFDFRIRMRGGESRLVDAKSTAGNFDNPIHLSLGELYRAVDGPEPYDIYRIHGLTANSARLRIARNIGQALQGVRKSLAALPDGITVDAISIRPDLLLFSEEEIILDASIEESC